MSGAQAQTHSPYLDLSGDWHTSNADNAQFSAEEWPDDDWDVIEVLGTGVQSEHEITWYRKTVIIPEDWAGDAIVMSVATRALIDVYVQGVRVAPVGTDGPNDGPLTAGFHLLDVPEARPGMPLTVAIRSAVPTEMSRQDITRLEGDGLLLGPRDLVTSTAPLQWRQDVLLRVLPNALMSGTFVLAGLFHFGLYLRRRKLYAYLWYSASMLLLAVWEGMNVYNEFMFVPASDSLRIQISVSRFSIATMLVFLWTLLGPKVRPRWVQVVIALQVFVGGVTALFGRDGLSQIGSPYQELTALAGVVTGLYIVVQVAWAGRTSARIVLFGCSMMGGAAVWAYFADMGLSPPLPSILQQVGELALVGSMAVAIMNEFAIALEQADQISLPPPSTFVSLNPNATVADLLAMSTLGTFDGATTPPALGIRNASSQEGPLAAGDLVGRYRVQARLGQGGMGVVLRAHDPDLSRDVAIKLVSGDGTGTDAARQSLLHREAVAMARCTHPNIITIYDVGVFRKAVFLAMEYLQGTTLRRWQSASDFPGSHAVIAAYVAAGRGLSAAHQAGIVHGDFKADNVMRTQDQRIVVVDFGIAQATQSSSGDSVPDALTDLHGVKLMGAGTPAFMAPELRQGGRSTQATDQYAFAVSLFGALFGIEVRQVANDVDTLRRALADGTVRPVDPAGVSATSVEVILRAMAESPDDRWPTMDPMLAGLSSST